MSKSIKIKWLGEDRRLLTKGRVYDYYIDSMEVTTNCNGKSKIASIVEGSFYWSIEEEHPDLVRLEARYDHFFEEFMENLYQQKEQFRVRARCWGIDEALFYMTSEVEVFDRCGLEKEYRGALHDTDTGNMYEFCIEDSVGGGTVVKGFKKVGGGNMARDKVQEIDLANVKKETNVLTKEENNMNIELNVAMIDGERAENMSDDRIIKAIESEINKADKLQAVLDKLPKESKSKAMVKMVEGHLENVKKLSNILDSRN